MWWQHADGEQARKKTIVIATVIPAIAAVLLAVGATLFVWRTRPERPTFKVSPSTLRQLNASSSMNLRFEVDRNNDPILLGKGAFGEVSSWTAMLCRSPELMSLDKLFNGHFCICWTMQFLAPALACTPLLQQLFSSAPCSFTC